MNIPADLLHPIEDELHDTQYKQEVVSITQQPQGFTPTVENILQFPYSLKYLPDHVDTY